MTDARKRLLRRLAAATIGGAFVVLLATVCVAPLAESWSAAGELIERSSQLLVGYRQVLDEKSAIDRRLAALRDQDAALSGLIGGASAPLAIATLQADVKQIIEAHGGKIQSMQPGAVTPGHGFERVEVKVDLSMAGGKFADFVGDLDQHQPFLSVDPLELHVPEGGPLADTLTIRMTVSAYRRSAAS